VRRDGPGEAGRNTFSNHSDTLSDVWEPVGPLSPAVYWRRRGVAMASAVALVGLVIATAGAPAGTPVPTANRTPVSTAPAPATGAGSAAGQAAAGPTATSPAFPSSSPAPTTAAATGGSRPTTSAPDLTAAAEGTPDALAWQEPPPSSKDALPDGTAPAGAVGGATAPAPRSTAPPTSTANPSATAPSSVPPSAAPPSGTTERIRPDDTPRPSAAQPSVPVPATGPVSCTNAMLSVAAELEHPVHEVGSHPVLRLVLTNVSGQPCVRDLDSARQEIVVWSADGADRLWSSNDCVNTSSIDLRTLVPGRPVAFAVTWGERTTTPGCRQPRTPVPAGTYRLMVRLDDLISPPTPFIRTP
jgi:hypothetical protein